jgi:hypothetical protein
MKKILFNPFEKYDGRPLMTIGLLITVVGSMLGYAFNARFDNAIHITFLDNVTLAEPLTDNIFNIASMFVAFYIFGYIINKKTRPIDILSMVMIARLPFYLNAFTNINGFMYKISVKILNGGTNALLENSSDLLIMTAAAFLSLALLVWYIALLYNGFRIAANIKTTTHKILFAVATIASLIISSIVFYIIY